MAHGEINQGGPEDGEQEKGGELDPFRKGAGDQRRGNDGEHQLKGAEQQVGNGGRVLAGLKADAGETGPVQIADQAAHVRAKGQGIAVDHPDDRDHAQADKTL